MTSFITDNYFGKLNLQNVYSNDKIIENKRFVLESINEFLIYKLNQNALLNNINNVIHNE
jgi:hypothetical protein